MRPIQLTVSAFGPYPDTETIDFAELADLGLFVVAGQNGAGKTSIFDALFYALYGSLPGRRSTYSHMRSDHATPEQQCSVTLDFASGNEMWRVARKPQQMRPRQRGSGFTEQKASATLFSLDTDGHPTAVANRINEVNDHCRRLVGLTGQQFERVVLLPQGEFSRMLTSPNTERREVLRALFDSQVFDDVTAALDEQARQAGRSHEADLLALDARLDELAGDVLSLAGDATLHAHDDLGTSLQAFRQTDLAQEEEVVTTLAVEAATASAALRQAQTDDERRRRRDALVDELAAHERHNADVSDRRSDIERARQADPVVTVSTQLAHVEQRRDAVRQQLTDHHEMAHRRLLDLGLDLDPADAATTVDIDHRLAELEQSMGEQGQTLARHDEQAQYVAEIADSRRATSATLATHLEHHATLQVGIANLKAELESLASDSDAIDLSTEIANTESLLQLRAELDRSTVAVNAAQHDLREAADIVQAQTSVCAEADLAAERYPVAQSAAEMAIVALSDAQEAVRVHQERSSVLDQLPVARRDLAFAEQHASRVFNRYVTGSAQRLATTLEPDVGCPVCGSCEHPAPASIANDDAPVEAVELDDAITKRDLARARCTELEQQLRDHVSAAGELGNDEATLVQQLDQAKREALKSQDRADQLASQTRSRDSAHRRLATLQQAFEHCKQVHHDAAQNQHRLMVSLGSSANTTLRDLRSRRHELQAQLEKAKQVDLHRARTRNELAHQVQAADIVAHKVTAAEQKLESVEHQLAEATQRLRQLAADTDGITKASLAMQSASIAAARSALSELHQSATLARDLEDQRVTLVDQLKIRLADSPFTSAEHAQASSLTAFELEELEAKLQAFQARQHELQGQLVELSDVPDHVADSAELAERSAMATSRHEQANRRLIERSSACDRIDDELARISERRASLEEHDDATRRLIRVAALAKGDNERRTPFESWVLAAFLRDIVELANIRLAKSTRGRFQLCVAHQGHNRRGMWGLDLEIEDTVTGSLRPTAGLSGGELFQASLALALGLADVVMEQAGGVRIETLFIDEGFGSLDASSVERAIDLLDGLRESGAMVGVITHVPALLHALPRGITVNKRADGCGSTIDQQPAAA